MDKWIAYFLDKPTDWLLVIFNGFLAVFTCRLWVSTNRLFKVTKVAADAADLSARAAIGIELPILRVQGSQIDLGDIEGDADLTGPYAYVLIEGLPTQHSVISDVEVKNFGRTLAFPLQIELGHAVATSLPSEPFYQKALKRPVGAFIEPNESALMQIDYGIHLTSEEAATVQAEVASLWFYFSIAYRDFMNNKHEARFCYEWARPDGIGDYCFTEGDAPAAYTQHT